jgi:SH3-like domain-containing protein
LRAEGCVICGEATAWRTLRPASSGYAWIEQNLANGKLRAVYKQFHGTDLPADTPKD